MALVTALEDRAWLAWLKNCACNAGLQHQMLAYAALHSWLLHKCRHSLPVDEDLRVGSACNQVAHNAFLEVGLMVQYRPRQQRTPFGAPSNG